jgi:integrase
VKVSESKLRGLKIYQSYGKWYVYDRLTKETLIKAFVGDRAAIKRHLATPGFLTVYSRLRVEKTPAKEFASETLGGLAYWFTAGHIDKMDDKEFATGKGGKIEGVDDCNPKWHTLAVATRKDYLAAFDWLRPEFDIELRDIRQPDLYTLRDKAANKKWGRFADKMIRAISSAFKLAVQRGLMDFNPCLGMDKVHAADPNANREWYPEELQVALNRAPLEIKTILMLARYAGLRGQTAVIAGWRQYRHHPKTGMAIYLTTKKNNEQNFLPALPELQEYLANLERKSTLIAVRNDGTPWPDEKDMQTRVSHYLRDLEANDLIGAGTTLHGLRVSYAAWWKRNGATNAEVADLLGDSSEAMGIHYTRHVERELNIIRAFERVQDKTD